MIAMLMGCGRRRDELLALNLESVQPRQEEHWLIADLVGKGREEPGCLEAALKAGAHRDDTLRIVPKANHARVDARVGNKAE
jgi:hypothetical protein